MSDYRYTVKHPGEDVLYSGAVREAAVEAYLSVSSLNEPAIRVERLVQTWRGDHWVTSSYEDIVEAVNVMCESLQRRAAGTVASEL
jgi:hypothetical protein